MIRSLTQLERSDDLLELVAPHLRPILSLADSDKVTITLGGYESRRTHRISCPKPPSGARLHQEFPRRSPQNTMITLPHFLPASCCIILLGKSVSVHALTRW